MTYILSRPVTHIWHVTVIQAPVPVSGGPSDAAQRQQPSRLVMVNIVAHAQFADTQTLTPSGKVAVQLVCEGRFAGYGERTCGQGAAAAASIRIISHIGPMVAKNTVFPTRPFLIPGHGFRARKVQTTIACHQPSRWARLSCQPGLRVL